MVEIFDITFTRKGQDIEKGQDRKWMESVTLYISIRSVNLCKC